MIYNYVWWNIAWVQLDRFSCFFFVVSDTLCTRFIWKNILISFIDIHILTLLVRFIWKVRCVVLATGVRVWSDVRMDEARAVCNDHSGWRSVVSAYPHGKKAWVYVCMYVYWTLNSTASLLYSTHVMPGRIASIRIKMLNYSHSNKFWLATKARELPKEKYYDH